VNLAEALAWVQRNRKWLAIGFSLVAPWVWLVAFDRVLRRKR
jgi:hypothetical protein